MSPEQDDRQDKGRYAALIQTQLEELLDTVWSAEANWAFDDRLDLAAALSRARHRSKES